MGLNDAIEDPDRATVLRGVSTVNGASTRRRRFVLEYCKIGLRRTATAVKARFSPKSRHCMASEPLADRSTSKQAKEFMGRLFESLPVDVNEALARIPAVAHADIRNLLDDNGHLLPTIRSGRRHRSYRPVG